MKQIFLFSFILLQLGCGGRGFTAITQVSENASELAVQCSSPVGRAFFVAPQGDDQQSGDQDHPFATPERALAAMRASSIKTTFMREGLYRLTKTVVIEAQDSGITLASYPCEQAVFDGSTVLSGFQDEGNQIYSLKVANPATFLELFVNNKRWRVASLAPYQTAQPVKSSWLFVTGGPESGATYDWFSFNSKDLNESSVTSLEGLTAQAFAWDRQNDTFSTVKQIDFAAKRINLSSALAARPSEGTYRLLNDRKFLRSEGEFTWSWKTDKILFLKTANAQTLQSVSLPSLQTLLQVQNTQNVTLRSLTFRNTRVGAGALSVSNSNNVRIGGNTFENVGTAISLKNTTSSLIAGNTIGDVGETGIELATGSLNNKIYANLVEHIGQVEKHAFGIRGYGASQNIVRQNTIRDSARYAISFKNWDDSTISKQNKVEFNDIEDTCTETADCGAIEFLGRSAVDTGSVIRNNRINRAHGLAAFNGAWYEGFKGFGIYLDDLTSGVTVSGNLLLNTGVDSAQIYLHGGHNNLVESNIGVLNEGAFLRLENVPQVGDAGVPYGNRVQKNIIYATRNLGSYSVYATGGTVQVDQNLLYNVSRFQINGVYQDSNSVIADPLFRNRITFDLSVNSPAIKLGFIPIDWSQLGASNFQPTDTLPVFW